MLLIRRLLTSSDGRLTCQTGDSMGPTSGMYNAVPGAITPTRSRAQWNLSD